MVGGVVCVVAPTGTMGAMTGMWAVHAGSASDPGGFTDPTRAPRDVLPIQKHIDFHFLSIV